MQTRTRHSSFSPLTRGATIWGGLLLVPILTACMLLNVAHIPQSVDVEATAAGQSAPTEPTQPDTPALQPTEKPAAETPLPQGPPTLAPPIATATPACTDLAALIYDVTVPDNTQMPPDRSFAKAWRLQNAGTCTWTTGYALVFDSGAQMGGPASQNLTVEAPPGATIDLSVVLTTPSTAGTFRGNWRLRNEQGVTFGLAGGEPFHVQLIVNP